MYRVVVGRTEVKYYPDVCCETKLFPLLILSKSTLKLLRDWAWGKVSHIETHNHITHFNIQLKCFIFSFNGLSKCWIAIWTLRALARSNFYILLPFWVFVEFQENVSVKVTTTCTYPWLVMFQCRLFYMEIKSLYHFGSVHFHTVPNSCINII